MFRSLFGRVIEYCKRYCHDNVLHYVDVIQHVRIEEHFLVTTRTAISHWSKLVLLRGLNLIDEKSENSVGRKFCYPPPY